MKTFRNFKNSEDGAAGVVVAILMIGLFISFYALVQAVYVPQWMEQKEAEHMDIVASQFTDIKSSIDILSISEKEYMPISNPVTLGSKEMPFFTTSRAYGTIDLKPNNFTIKLENSEKTATHSLGSLRYSSENAYFVDQEYVYENGALILSQQSRDIIIVEPSIYKTKLDLLKICLVKLSENGRRCSASGYGTYPVQTKFLSKEDISFGSLEKITITSSYKDAWGRYFNDTFSKYYYDFTIANTTDNTGIEIEFTDPDGHYPTVNIEIFEIEVQVSHGWFE
ncbi:MAG: hypothetical protein KAW45_02350 [Thermoplasmatales archaeon]|nr:hypothetical protein [Thermoplasmatales archaeon]